METFTNLSTDEELVDAAVVMLRALLPQTWTIETNPATVYAQQVGAVPIPSRPGRFDGTLTIQAPNSGFAALVIEARKTFAPRDALSLLNNLNPVYRRQNPAGMVVIATRLSKRTRDLLTQYGVHYIDLSGRVYIRVDTPPLLLDRDFADDRPEPSETATQLRGPRAGRIVRVLLDAAPPFRVKEVAAAAHVSVGYVSKALDALDAEALVQRGNRGEVIDCDWPGLLRRWANSSSMLTGKRAARFIAPRGQHNVADVLLNTDTRWVISGSFVAATLAPVAAPAVLVAYVDDIAEVQARSSMLPTEQGADVLLVEPTDPVVFDRKWFNGLYPVASPAQVAADCLNGPGRMPAEGEALMSWMQNNVSLWRAPNLESFGDPQTELSLAARPLFNGRN